MDCVVGRRVVREIYRDVMHVGGRATHRRIAVELD